MLEMVLYLKLRLKATLGFVHLFGRIFLREYREIEIRMNAVSQVSRQLMS